MSVTEAGEVGLRGQLIAVTLDLLATEGVEAVSLREIARRAGVSHNAPLRHFRSLSALLSEVAVEGFRRLGAHAQAAVDACGPGASVRDRCAAGIRAYAEFGLANPGHFNLMFRPDLLGTPSEEVAAAGFATFDLGVELTRAYQAEGWNPDVDPRVLQGVMWGAVHGATMLWAHHSMQDVTGARSFDHVLDALIEVTLR
jgi:AcrR family transcriptional regulator